MKLKELIALPVAVLISAFYLTGMLEYAHKERGQISRPARRHSSKGLREEC
jgi:hypothetical protein